MIEIGYLVSFRPQEKAGDRNYCNGVMNIPIFSIMEEENFPNIPEDAYFAFTSTTAFSIFKKKRGINGIREPCFAVGRSTGEIMIRNGLNPVIPRIHDSMSLAETISNRVPLGSHIIIPSNSMHEIVLDHILESTGFKVSRIYLYHYRTLEISGEMEKLNPIDGMVFTSPGEVREFHRQTEGKYTGIRVHSIGRITANELMELGYENAGIVGNGHFDEVMKKVCQERNNSGEWI